MFQKDKSTISRHIKNIFSSEELERESVVANFATTAKDGKTYQVDYYNLDMIISIGYRVNSKIATNFRKWATRVLKQYLVDILENDTPESIEMYYQFNKQGFCTLFPKN